VFRAVNAIAPSSTLPTADYTNWELYRIRADVTLMIGPNGTVPSLQAAWAYIQNATIDGGAYVHLLINDEVDTTYEETYSQPFLLNHADGEHISIGVADATTANSILFNFTDNGAGFALTGGHTFGGIYGTSDVPIQIQGTYETKKTIKPPAPPATLYGIQVIEGSCMAGMSYVEILNCREGLEAGSNATIYGDHLSFAHTLDCVEAVYGGYASLTNLTINQSSPGNGLEAIGGVITAVGATISDQLNGVYARDQGFIDVSGATITSNFVGILSSENSHVKAEGATIATSFIKDVEVYDLSVVDAIGATYTTWTVGASSTLMTADTQ